MSAPTRRRRRRAADLPAALDIAGVVLGEHTVPLDKPDRRLALEAMNALGYGTPYIAEVLGVTERGLAGVASRYQVSLRAGRAFVDEVAVEFVLQGTPMALRGNDLAAALVRLAEQGATLQRCARLLRTDVDMVRYHARKLGLDLPLEDPKSCWWNDYADRTRTTDRTRGADESEDR